ncbi:MAG: 6-phosphogluconolactonase [Terriglobales bacterium]
MLEWVTRPTLAELTEEFCRRLDQIAGLLGAECPVALTGGESAAVFYDAWATHGVRENLEFYWSDERMVLPADSDSNFKLAQDRLLSRCQVAESRIHPVPTDRPLAECAADYASAIRRGVREGPSGTPQFPLVLLGLGADGHTASLLPGRNPYLDEEMLVRAVEGTAMHPHGRITFTPLLINTAAHVWFIVTGAKKAWAVEQLAGRTAPLTRVPALAVDPKRTRITIFADQSSTGGRKY